MQGEDLTVFRLSKAYESDEKGGIQEMEIKVLGAGCANCDKLERLVVEVLKELKEVAAITHIRDFKEIASFGVMRTPALVIDGQVKLAGLVPSREKLKEIITGEMVKRG